MAIQSLEGHASSASAVLNKLSTSELEILIRALITTNSTRYFTNVTSSFSAGSAIDDGAEDLIRGDDAVWILTSTFIIFTMQSGFGLLESGSVAAKNEVNIMVKNAGDVIFGGISYWLFGYALSFGDGPLSNPFCGAGHFAVTAEEANMGLLYSRFFFQSSFATTATTIVSGAMAERTKLGSYLVFSFVNTLVYVVPAHWVWAENGWLHTLGFVDMAGCGPVHVLGGATGLVATLILKPRHGRFANGEMPMGSPTNVLLGMFMLWWGWLGFNCGSTFGISGAKFKLAASRSAVTTVNGSVGGGATGIILSYLFKNRKFHVNYVVNGVLGGLVGITAICALAEPWQGIIIGAVGALLAIWGDELLKYLKVDDPVGCVGVHMVAGIWGLLSVGLFGHTSHISPVPQHDGLFYGGGLHLLGVQLLGIVVIFVWSVTLSGLLLLVVQRTIGLRLSLEHELQGCDVVEHNVGGVKYGDAGDLMSAYESRRMADTAEKQVNTYGVDVLPFSNGEVTSNGAPRGTTTTTTTTITTTRRPHSAPTAAPQTARQSVTTRRYSTRRPSQLAFVRRGGIGRPVEPVLHRTILETVS